MLACDTFTTDPRQKRIKFDFLQQSSPGKFCAAIFVRTTQEKQFARAM
jgi:hypothetical protein